MDLTEIIGPQDIMTNLAPSSRDDLLRDLAIFVARGTGTTPEAILELLLEREELGSTGIGAGIAVPHAIIDGLVRPRATLAVLNYPVNYDASDDLPVDLIFLLLTPKQNMAEHLRILQSFCRLTKRESFLSSLRQQKSAEEVYGLLKRSPDNVY
ncbi:PTS sugar transporter subunit IIA [Brucella intermedia]|nr:PTS sugar transporter subunit IIA [Brucella intermedia]